MRINLVASIVLVMMPFLASPDPTTENDRPLTALPEVAGMRYCSGDAEVFTVWLQLIVKFLNRGDKTLILDREIGKVRYSVKVARNLEELAAGKYEYNPSTVRVFSDKDKLPEKPDANLPGSDLVILLPHQIIRREVSTSLVVQYESPKSIPGSIRSGTHVFQLELTAWNHPGQESDHANSWRKYGQLITGLVKTRPLEIRIPSNPKVEECK